MKILRVEKEYFLLLSRDKGIKVEEKKQNNICYASVYSG
jgi:hypothetical protein